MLSSTVRCGNRLNCWNTIPTSERILSMLRRSLRQLDAVDDDVAALVDLESVDAADERRLAGAGRAEHDHHLSVLDEQVDPAEGLEVAEPLVDAATDDDVVAGSQFVGEAVA